MKWYFFILTLSSYFNYIENANILGIFPFPGKSHFVMYERILRGLAEKGHQVDVYSHFPLKKPVEGYNDISLVGTQSKVFMNFTEMPMPIASAPRIMILYLMMTEGGYKSCEASFNSDMLKSLRNSQKKYDLVITELFVTDCMLGWSYHFGIPVVAMTSSVALPWANNRFANPDNPSYIPIYDVNFLPRMTLYERVVNTFSLITANLLYNDISLVGTQSKVFMNFTEMPMPIASAPRIMILYLMMTEGGYKSCEASFNSDMLKSLRNSQKKYDLVITELFVTDCMLGWSYHFGIPVVAMTSSVALPWANNRFANPDNPSYIPIYDVNFLPRMTLYERVVNTFSLITANLLYLFSERRSNELAKEFFGQDMPDLQELIYNTSLILVNSHFSTNQARPTVSNFIEVGGVHINEPKPLNKHFQEILTTDSKGIIYLSMGTMVLTETLPVAKIQAIFDAFAELPYKVVWKADKDYFPKEVKFPENIHFENWMPQLDILCHPNVKLFVSHGGLMGSQEALYCAVPVIGIPLFADQELNIKQSENMGLAIKIDFHNITKESVLEAATKILNNPKYQETANLISRRFKDRPMSPLDTAIYWIEYVIRHKGAPHLRSAGVELHWYQYHLLDVSVTLVLISIVLAYLLLCIVKLCKSVRNHRKSKKD